MRWQSARSSGHHSGKAPELAAVPGGRWAGGAAIGTDANPSAPLVRPCDWSWCFFKAWELMFCGGGWG